MASSENYSEFKQIHYIQLSNGEKYAYRKAGNQGKVLILVHGNLSSGSFYSIMAPLLAPYFTVIAPDLRGFGHSTYNKPIASHADLADDLNLFIDALNIPKCSLAGIGLGGGIVFMFGVKYPEKPDKIIFFCSMGPKGSIAPDVKELPKNKEEATKNSPMLSMAKQSIDNKTTEGFKKFFLYVWNKIEDDFLNLLSEEALLQRNLEDISWMNANYNVSNEIGIMNTQGNNLAAKFEKEALIFGGENDRSSPPEMQKEWKKLLGDHATLKLLPNYGPGPKLDQVEETANIFKEFLLA
jgi:pimeloyl-ACP methyl ester carboxylesterase